MLAGFGPLPVESGNTETKLSFMAPIFTRISFTITLKSGRRAAIMSINIMPSIEPIGWLDMVINAPSGKLSSISAWCRLYLISIRGSLSNAVVNAEPRRWQLLACTLFTLSTLNHLINNLPRKVPIRLLKNGAASCKSLMSTTLFFILFIYSINDAHIFSCLRIDNNSTIFNTIISYRK